MNIYHNITYYILELYTILYSVYYTNIILYNNHILKYNV